MAIARIATWTTRYLRFGTDTSMQMDMRYRVPIGLDYAFMRGVRLGAVARKGVRL